VCTGKIERDREIYREREREGEREEGVYSLIDDDVPREMITVRSERGYE
jgi:hypothetical protein